MVNWLDVAVGVIYSSDDRYLVAQRASQQHLGGCWEFPGGKLEAGETALEALKRELAEEVNLAVHHAEPLVSIKHQYQEQLVRLHVYFVEQWSGELLPRLGQPLRWVELSALPDYRLPAANQAILTALNDRLSFC